MACNKTYTNDGTIFGLYLGFDYLHEEDPTYIGIHCITTKYLTYSVTICIVAL